MIGGCCFYSSGKAMKYYLKKERRKTNPLSLLPIYKSKIDISSINCFRKDGVYPQFWYKCYAVDVVETNFIYTLKFEMSRSY